MVGPESPELSVVCKSCGSEVSPYVTECPYCGTRLRKRAPKLERVGDEVRVREDRRDRRRRKAAERRERLAGRVDLGERLEARPLVTIAALAAPALLLIVERATNLGIYDLGAIIGPVGDEWWRYLAAPFVYDDLGYLFVCGLAIAIFLPPVERRVGAVASLLLVARLRRARHARRRRPRVEPRRRLPGRRGRQRDRARRARPPDVVLRDAERRADPTDEYDRIAVAVAAIVVLLLPLVEDIGVGLGRPGRRPGRRRLRARRRARGTERSRAVSVGAIRGKYTPLDDDLHAYVVDHGARQDEVLRRIQAETEAMGEIARMQIAPDQGALITMLCRMLDAREAIELGTFTGYSAICIARGLAPGGRLIACELSEEYAETAARNLDDAGVADRVEIRIGPAAATLRDLPEREFLDFTFIDADKTGYPDYYELALARTRPGGLIMLDNVLAGGNVGDGPGNPLDNFTADSIAAIERINAIVAADDRVDVAMLSVSDGVTLARKR